MSEKKYFRQLLINIRYGLVICPLLLLFIACNSEESGNIVEHPIEEKIPYYDNDHLSVDTVKKFSQMPKKPDKLIFFQQVLKNPGKFKTKKLDILVSEPELGLNVISKNKNVLVILDPGNDKIFEYNLNTDEVITVAGTGRGPGDIMFSQEMTKYKNSIYVAGANMQISAFEYKSTPSEFRKVIPISFIPTSIAPYGDSLAILGTPDVRNASGNKLEDNGENWKVVHLIDKKGTKVAEFGDSYDIDGHWMLLRPFVSNGVIRYSSKEDIFILAFNRFPLLYIYDARDLKLKNTFSISNFVIGKSKYWPDMGRFQVPMEDHSSIKNVHLIGDQFLWIEVGTRKNYRNERPYWDRWIDYYVIDLSTSEEYYMGGLEVTDNSPGQQFYFTDNGLVIHEEGTSSLFYTQYLKIIR